MAAVSRQGIYSKDTCVGAKLEHCAVALVVVDGGGGGYRKWVCAFFFSLPKVNPAAAKYLTHQSKLTLIGLQGLRNPPPLDYLLHFINDDVVI